MGFPAGMQLATIAFGIPLTATGKNVVTKVTVKPTSRVIWAATGQPLPEFSDSFTAEAGQLGQFQVPFVDQAGFIDSTGAEVTDFAYQISASWEFANERPITWDKNLKPLVGQTGTLDLDLVPDGPVSIPVTAPTAAVLGFGGRTGFVTLQESDLPQRLSVEDLSATYGTYESAIKWGADPTGATYSDAAVEALLSAFPDRGVTCFFPKGRYKFAAPIIPGNGTKFLGAGGLMTSQANSAALIALGGPAEITYRPETVLEFPDGTDGFATPNSSDYNYRAHGIEIRNLTILGSGAANPTRGVWWRKNVLNEDANHIYGKVGLSSIDGCYIEGFGTGVDGDGTSDSCSVLNSHIHDCGKGVIDGDSETQVIRSCIWALTTGPAIEANGDRGVFSFNEIEPGIACDGIKIFGNDNKVISNDFKDSATALVLWGPRNSVTGNSFSRAIQNHAVLIGRSNGEQAAHDCTVSGNTITDYGVTLAGGIDAIVVYGGANRAVITGNTLSGPGTFAATATVPPARAVRLRTTTSGTPVAPTGCIVTSNSSNGLTDPWSDDGLGSIWNSNLPLDPYQTAPGDGSRLITGRYVTPAFSKNGSNLTIANETLFAVPVVFSNSGTLDRLAIYINVAGQAGAKVRLGIYRDNGTGAYPGTLVVDTGQLAADAVGAVVATISVPVTAGVYWLAAVAQSAATTQPTVPCPLSMYPRVMPTNAADAVQAAARSYQQTGVSGALPATFTVTPATGIRDPLMAVRAV